MGSRRDNGLWPRINQIQTQHPFQLFSSVRNLESFLLSFLLFLIHNQIISNNCSYLILFQLLSLLVLLCPEVTLVSQYLKDGRKNSSFVVWIFAIE